MSDYEAETLLVTRAVVALERIADAQEKYVEIYEVSQGNSASMMLATGGLLERMVGKVAPNEDDDV